MTEPNDPAFPPDPENILYEKTANWHCCGLTKREYFAVMAMQSVLISLSQYNNQKDDKVISRDFAADLACMYADALIEALNKEKK